MTTQSVMPASSTTDSPMRHPYVLALHQSVLRRGTSPLYLVFAAAVAGLMLLLPIIYLALIGAAAYGVCWYAIHGAVLFEDLRSARVALVAYAGPLVIGIILIAFMIKPLFARRRIMYAPQALSRRDEPLLFAFIDRLCESLGAPKPFAIHIDMNMNASAGFSGAFSGIFGGRLVLTLGLPLIAGMNLTSFTGVLAHEFGHFRQRGGMRLNYAIRSIIGWFGRVVYERDNWDATLEQASSSRSHWGIQLIALLSRGMVWFSRRILWLLMMSGHLFSAFLLRQGEYDADGYCACVVGSNASQEALRSLPLLGAAMEVTYGDLRKTLAEKRLPDNVPQLVAHRARGFTEEARAAIWQRSVQRKAGWFDSHPALASRIAHIERMREPGVFNVNAPASSLLLNFAPLSRLMTLELYRSNLGRRVEQLDLVESDTIEAHHDEQSRQAVSLTEYLADLVSPMRPVFLPDDPVEGDRRAVARQLLALRAAFGQAVPAAKAAASAWEAADTELMTLEAAAALIHAGVPAAKLKGLAETATDVAMLRRRREELEKSRAVSRRQIDAALSLAMQALRAAVQLGAAPRLARTQEESYDLAEEVAAGPLEKQLAALLVIRSTSPLLEELRRLFRQQAALLRRASAHGGDSHFVGAVVSLSRKQTALVERLRGALKNAAYPYSPQGRPMTVASYVFLMPTRPEDVGKTMGAVEHGLSQIYALYLRLMADVADDAQGIEHRLRGHKEQSAARAAV